MKNLKLLTVAVVLAELMVMSEKVAASDQEPERSLTPIAKNDERFIQNNISMEEKRRARHRAARQKLRDETARANAAEEQVRKLQQELQALKK